MIVITGGAGFIGSALLAKLNSEGITEILVVDRMQHSEKWKNLQGKYFLDYMHKDLFLKELRAGRFTQNITAIYHIGACSLTTETDGDYLMDNNYRYSKLLAEFALNKNIRFIYASSAATYGDGKQGFSDSDSSKLINLQALNRYGFSKHIFDLWAYKSNALDKILGFKFFNVYGPNEYHKEEMRSVVHKAFGQVQEHGKIDLFRSYREDCKDGEQTRDFIYVKDVVDTLYQALVKPQINGLYNLGSAKANSWNELAKTVFLALEKEIKINYIEMPESLRGKYQYHTEAQMDLAKQAGFSINPTPLKEGVNDYIKNYLLLNKHL